MPTPATHIELPVRDAPRPFSAPWDPAPRAAAPPSSAIDAALAQGATHIRLGGGEPLAHPHLHDLLARITAGGAQGIVRTRLPGLHDDEPVRPFAPHDVRFEVELPFAPHHHPEQWESVEGGLRNLKAFAYPFDLVVPITTANVHQVAEIVAHVHGTDLSRGVHLEVLSPQDEADPRWALAPTWAQVDQILATLNEQALRPPPRLTVSGMPIAGLSVSDYPNLDLRTDAAPSDHPTPSLAYVAHHGTPIIGTDDLARRRTWLATPAKERPGFRGDARDRFDSAVAVVLVRPHEGVFAVVEPRVPSKPYLATTTRHGLAVYGRMQDPVLADRFRTLCRMAYAEVASADLQGIAELRSWAHVLRRSMKPSQDGHPIRVRYESE